MPATLEVWRTLLFITLVVPPSPKLQDQLVTLPLDVSVKVTVSGTRPLVGLPVKLATGGKGPRSSLYTVPKLSPTATLPINPPSLAIVPLSNCEIATEPTDDNPVVTVFVAYRVCAPILPLVGFTYRITLVPPATAWTITRYWVP